MQKTHPFHIMNLSLLPIITSFTMLILAIGGLMLLKHYASGKYILFSGVVGVALCLYYWWKQVIAEGLIEKQHNRFVRKGLRIGMLLFILSEIMFFFGLFFSYFYARLFPVGILDGVWPIKEGIWPPAGIKTFDPWDLPLMNTLILLLSGTTITWAHHALIYNKKTDFLRALRYTIILGIMFTCFQAYEYHHAAFKFTDGVYASNFYMATGFHGVHVIVGTIFLIVCYIRGKKGHFFDGKNHLGFDFAAWYWHFVDVVWLFLFIFLYILGR